MSTVVARDGRFLARVRLQGESVAKTFTRKADAIKWARDTECSIESGRFISKAAAAAAAAAIAPTMGEALAQYRQAPTVRALKGFKVHQCWFDALARLPMATKRIDQVTPFEIAAWRDELSAGLAPGTVVRRLSLLSGLFSWARTERGWIKENPVSAIKKPAVNDARDRVLSVEERRYLLQAAGTSKAGWLGDVLTVLLQSAMRRSEVWGLQRDQVDQSQAIARLADAKCGARDVPLCPLALAALRRLDAAAAAAGRTGLVPLSDPHAITVAFRCAVNRALRNYGKDCAAAGVVPDASMFKGLRLHDCRHTAATAWALTGRLSVFQLQKITGHSSLKMLGRYVNLKASDVSATLAALSV
jgi:integrase